MRLGQVGAEARRLGSSLQVCGLCSRDVWPPGVESPPFRGIPAAVRPLTSAGYYSSCGRGVRLRLRGRLPLVQTPDRGVLSGLQLTIATLLTAAPPALASSTLNSCAGQRPRQTCGWPARGPSATTACTIACRDRAAKIANLPIGKATIQQ
eukprot:scaffold44033_cov50-Phaeocystis_antarctica.AAC.2